MDSAPGIAHPPQTVAVKSSTLPEGSEGVGAKLEVLWKKPTRR